MKREDILHLADLARIELTDTEIERFSKEFGAILGYVDSIKSMTQGEKVEPTIGALHNVFREDVDPHEAGIYTEDILSLAPQREKQYVKVKKILGGNI